MQISVGPVIVTVGPIAEVKFRLAGRLGHPVVDELNLAAGKPIMFDPKVLDVNVTL
jgi:hypothetical protein